MSGTDAPLADLSAPAPPLPSVEYGQRSDPGRDPDKQVNEDACGHRPTRFGHLCVVCDGMGGHAAGREAAELAVSTIFEVLDEVPAGVAPGEALRGAIDEANRRVYQMRSNEMGFGRPGSTVFAILLHQRGTEVAHVGDSRAYLAHAGEIVRLTRDHSIVQELVDRGLLTARQAFHHPEANRITRALGMSANVEVDLRPRAVHHIAGDAFLLCSDGLCDQVEDDEILAILGEGPAAQAVGKLVDLANARGGHDNITAVVLRARETAASAPVAPTLAETDVAPSAATPTLPDRARISPVLIAAVVFASVTSVLLAALLVSHLRDRSGKSHGAEPATLGLLAGDGGTSPEPAASLAPEVVVLPPAASAHAAEPIAPLTSGPIESRRKKR